MSGSEDVWDLEVDYVPGREGFVLELESLRVLVSSFRDREVFDFQVCDDVFDALKSALEPLELTVRVRVNVQGAVMHPVVTRSWRSEERPLPSP